MEPLRHTLKDDRTLLIREATARDAEAAIAHVNAIIGETDYMGMGPGDFDVSVEREREFLDRCRETDNQLYLVGLLDEARDAQIVSILSFSGGHRPRTRHTGEFGLSVRKEQWGLGIGALMLDALLDWARGTRIVTKVNLRVRTDNRRALALYLHRGFALEGTIRKAICIDGVYYDHHCMGVELHSKGSDSDV
jgi:RimJ/RimL family protein N-acetyltransferase